ncbi:MAG: toxin-antitoxin system YwqK family antitoxin [Cellvibrionaceae bacterium]
MKTNRLFPSFSIVSLSVFLLIGSLIVGSRTALADAIDLAQLKPEHYSKLKHRSVVTDKDGNSYRVHNKEWSKGLYISIKAKGKDTWKKHGAFYRYRDGKIIELTTYAFGLKQGINEVYSEKGLLKRRLLYSKDKKNGPAEEFDDKGVIFKRMTYKDSQKHGKFYIYHNEKVSFEKDYVNGDIHGKVIQYDRHGNVEGVSHYVRDKQVGKTQWR